VTTPDARAPNDIDAHLAAADWLGQDLSAINVHAARGVAIREYSLTSGHGFADYLHEVDCQEAGVVEAQKAGTSIPGFELQRERYGNRVPAGIPAPIRPLRFLCQSTGVETLFTNRLDPTPKSREVFTVHRPKTMAEWPAAEPRSMRETGGEPHPMSLRPSSPRGQLTVLPPVDDRGTGPAVGHVDVREVRAPARLRTRRPLPTRT